MKKYNLAIVGVTGLVGRMFLKILDEYHFPFRPICFHRIPYIIQGNQHTYGKQLPL